MLRQIYSEKGRQMGLRRSLARREEKKGRKGEIKEEGEVAVGTNPRRVALNDEVMEMKTQRLI